MALRDEGAVRTGDVLRPLRLIRPFATLAVLATLGTPLCAQTRVRALGIVPGTLQPGPLNAITDVGGVRVGHSTVQRGDTVNTGVTAIWPHGGNVYQERVPAALFVGNGFGKLVGATQLTELGELETPILLSCTLCVWTAADAMAHWMLAQPGMERVRSINPVVGETNDGFLNAIRSHPISPEDVRAALEGAREGPVAEGSVGAGTGTIAFGWKGGIGTSSRMAETPDGRWTVGVLVQSNFGGDLTMVGVPLGRLLRRNGMRPAAPGRADGSIVVVIATDAPLSDRNLERLASRAMLGIARTGSWASNGSGDYAIAFSTHVDVRRKVDARRRTLHDLANDEMSALFQAAVEATEEAIYNSLTMATTVRSPRGTVEALPLPEVAELFRQRPAHR